MKDYIGVKVVTAEPMSRGEYNEYRGWKIPSDENPEDEGYHIRYPDGYESWCPKKQFEEAYRRYDGTKLPSTAILMNSGDYKDRFKAELNAPPKMVYRSTSCSQFTISPATFL